MEKRIYHSQKHAFEIYKSDFFFTLRHHNEHIIRARRGEKKQEHLMKRIIKGLIENHKKLGINYENKFQTNSTAGNIQ